MAQETEDRSMFFWFAVYTIQWTVLAVLAAVLGASLWNEHLVKILSVPKIEWVTLFIVVVIHRLITSVNSCTDWQDLDVDYGDLLANFGMRVAGMVVVWILALPALG